MRSSMYLAHILIFIESLSAGGAERVLVTILKHLDYSKYRVTLMPLVDTGVLKKHIDMSKINYSPVIHQTNNFWQKIINKIKYKLIYSYLPCKIVNRWIIPQKDIDTYIAFTEGFSTKLISYSPKRKYAWVHADLGADPWTLTNRIYRNIKEEQNAYNQFDEVVCVSKYVERVMNEQYGIPHTTTIYNPIDYHNIIKKAKQPTDRKLSPSFNIVSLGRLVPQKGFDRLINAVGKLRNEGNNIELYIIGEGIERKHLEDIIMNGNLQNCIHLTGFMSNPYPLMSKMNLFVCSSRAEGYSLAIAEAIILGLPVVSTDCAGPKELLGNGKYGMLVNNNEDAIYEGLSQIICSPSIINDLRLKSVEKQKSFGIKRSLDQIEHLFGS